MVWTPQTTKWHPPSPPYNLQASLEYYLNLLCGVVSICPFYLRLCVTIFCYEKKKKGQLLQQWFAEAGEMDWFCWQIISVWIADISQPSAGLHNIVQLYVEINEFISNELCACGCVRVWS